MKIPLFLLTLILLTSCQNSNNTENENVKNNIIIAESFHTKPECNNYNVLEILEFDNTKEGLMKEVHSKAEGFELV